MKSIIANFFTKAIVTEFIRTGDREYVLIKRRNCRTLLGSMFLVWNWERRYKAESEFAVVEKIVSTGKLIKFEKGEKGEYVLQIDVIW